MLVRVALFAALVCCKQEKPEAHEQPAPSVMPSVPPSVAAAASSAPSFVRGVVEVRPAPAVLADPTSQPRIPFDVAAGVTGLLRVELVDRIANDHAQEPDPRDPRAIFIDDIHVDAPGIVHVELTFTNAKGALVYEVRTTGTRQLTFRGPVELPRRPVGEVHLTAGALHQPTLLDAAKYLPVGWFVWGPREAGAPSLTIDEKSRYPHWVLRMQFRRTS